MPFALSVIIGAVGGAVLAVVQHLLTGLIAAHVLGRAKGVKLAIVLKMPLSIAFLALLAFVSLEALAFAAAGFTIVTIVIIIAGRRKGE